VVIAIRLFVPALVLSVVMAVAVVAAIFVLVPSLMLPVVVVVVMSLTRCGDRQRFPLKP